MLLKACQEGEKEIERGEEKFICYRHVDASGYVLFVRLDD